MAIKGVIICKNEDSHLAAADIGWGEGIVVELNDSNDVKIGDTLSGLSRGYMVTPCYNETSQSVLTVTVLSGGLPMDAACEIVSNEFERIAS